VARDVWAYCDINPVNNIPNDRHLPASSAAAGAERLFRSIPAGHTTDGVWVVIMAARASRAAREVFEQQNDTAVEVTAEDRAVAGSAVLAQPVPA